MASKEVASRSLPPSDESYYDEEEEEEASDSDYDLREYGLAPSLPTTTAEAFVDGNGGVGGDGDDDGEVIVDESEGFSAALRYLASVRLEARTVPQTVVAEPRRERHERQGGGGGGGEEERETSATDREEKKQKAPLTSPAPLLPPAAASASDAVSLADPWLQAFLDDFAELRREVTEAREVEHRDAWRLGAVEGRRKQEEEEEEDRLPRSWRVALGLSSRREQQQQQQQQQQLQQPPQNSPSARFLASLPQPQIVDALECVAEAVREFLEEIEEEEMEEQGDKEEEEKGLSSAVIVTPAVALWTFSLAANLERPVPPHASAALSALGKAAGAEAKRRRLRERKQDEKEGEEEESAASSSPSSSSRPSSSFLAASSPCPHAAVVAAVCGAYFVQCEVLSRAAKEGWP